MLANLLIKFFEAELHAATRDQKRTIHQLLDECRWVVFYPRCTDPSLSFKDTVYSEVQITFSTREEPEYISRRTPHLVDTFTLSVDHEYYCSWKELAAHMPGSIWVSTKDIQKAEVEPCPYSILDTAPEIMKADNSYICDAVISFMGVEDTYYDLISEIEMYVSSLPPSELCISVVYEDVTRELGKLPFGSMSAVIRYQNEIVGYMSMSGRELLYSKYFTTDMEKWRKCLKDIVDKSGCYDKMKFYGVTVIGTDDVDADMHIPVPGFTPKKYDIED